MLRRDYYSPHVYTIWSILAKHRKGIPQGGIEGKLPESLVRVMRRERDSF